MGRIRIEMNDYTFWVKDGDQRKKERKKERKIVK